MAQQITRRYAEVTTCRHSRTISLEIVDEARLKVRAVRKIPQEIRLAPVVLKFALAPQRSGCNDNRYADLRLGTDLLKVVHCVFDGAWGP